MIEEKEPKKTVEETSETKSQDKIGAILNEDSDNTIDGQEISRIFRIYLGREATPEENSRFEGIKESERKILETYLDKESTKINEEDRLMSDQNKIRGDLDNKRLKVEGEQSLGMLKNGMQGTGAPMQNPTMPASTGMPNKMPSSPSTGTPTTGEPSTNKTIRDGRYFLVNFNQ